MIFIRTSTKKACVAALVTFCLMACEPVAPANHRTFGDLDGLPLTAKSRAELQAILTEIAALGDGHGCTAREVDFIEVSLKGSAVGIDEPLTEPWSASEKARYNALMQRWQSLGGDSGDVSPACRRGLAVLKLPIL